MVADGAGPDGYTFIPQWQMFRPPDGPALCPLCFGYLCTMEIPEFSSLHQLFIQYNNNRLGIVLVPMDTHFNRLGIVLGPMATHSQDTIKCSDCPLDWHYFRFASDIHVPMKPPSLHSWSFWCFFLQHRNKIMTFQPFPLMHPGWMSWTCSFGKAVRLIIILLNALTVSRLNLPDQSVSFLLRILNHLFTA